MKRISFPYQQNDFECPPISYMNEYAKVVYVLATRIDDCRPTDVVSVLKDVRNFETYSKEHTPTKHTALNHVPMFSVAELAMLFLLLELDDFPQMDQEEETNQTIGNLDTSTTTQIKDSSAENILMSIIVPVKNIWTLPL